MLILFYSSSNSRRQRSRVSNSRRRRRHRRSSSSSCSYTPNRPPGHDRTPAKRRRPCATATSQQHSSRQQAAVSSGTAVSERSLSHGHSRHQTSSQPRGPHHSHSQKHQQQQRRMQPTKSVIGQSLLASSLSQTIVKLTPGDDKQSADTDTATTANDVANIHHKPDPSSRQLIVVDSGKNSQQQKKQQRFLRCRLRRRFHRHIGEETAEEDEAKEAESKSEEAVVPMDASEDNTESSGRIVTMAEASTGVSNLKLGAPSSDPAERWTLERSDEKSNPNSHNNSLEL
ncbi:unnamed protein product [Protopolystoma xenopodis]|uniref:Uncharacterized protein n=1 Tax=Protopolystoma xenopodis TaxID=117903 RepID=A0A448WWG6_9PLAT|nr:unnamed protein product [Protopolystoma xenopodis]